MNPLTRDEAERIQQRFEALGGAICVVGLNVAGSRVCMQVHHPAIGMHMIHSERQAAHLLAQIAAREEPTR